MDKRYRHEWKHEITYMDLLMIRQRMAAIARLDPHAVGGSYHIRSLYFDNMADKALREKIDGVNGREKFRIRYYDLDPSVIFLEKKSRLNGLGTKYSARLTKEEAQKIVDHKINWMIDDERPLVKELFCQMRGLGLQPTTIVDYTREPFVFAAGNVRVTLDYNIRTGLRSTDFLNPDCVTIPAGDAPIILEVKWDDFQPDIIRDAVQLHGCRVGSFSKYAQCRVYG